MFPDITQEKNILIRQRHELAELFGFETRNKYEIMNERGSAVAFAAEQGKGFLNLLMRGFLGHWRTFEIHFFNKDRSQIMSAKHPFRWFFNRLEVYDNNGQLIGILQKRFSILAKKFDVLNANEKPSMTVRSPIWRIWTFPFVRNGSEIAFVRKKWSGFFSEIGTDRDNFMVEFTSPSLTQKERQILLAAGVFIDLMYFERKAND